MKHPEIPNWRMRKSVPKFKKLWWNFSYKVRLRLSQLFPFYRGRFTRTEKEKCLKDFDYWSSVYVYVMPKHFRETRSPESSC